MFGAAALASRSKSKLRAIDFELLALHRVELLPLFGGEHDQARLADASLAMAFATVLLESGLIAAGAAVSAASWILLTGSGAGFPFQFRSLVVGQFQGLGNVLMIEGRRAVHLEVNLVQPRPLVSREDRVEYSAISLRHSETSLAGPPSLALRLFVSEGSQVDRESLPKLWLAQRRPS